MSTYKTRINGSLVEATIHETGGFTIVSGKVHSVLRDTDAVHFSVEKDIRNGMERRVIYVKMPPSLKDHQIPLSLSAGQIAYDECARLSVLLDAIEEGDLADEFESLIRDSQFEQAARLINLAFHVDGSVCVNSIHRMFSGLLPVLRQKDYYGSVRGLIAIVGNPLFLVLREMAGIYYHEPDISTDHLMRALDDIGTPTN